MTQDRMLQEMMKTRIALEKIAKSLEKIDKSLYLSTRTPMDIIRDDVLKEDHDKAKWEAFDTAKEPDIREAMHYFMKEWGEQNGLIDED